MIAFSIFQKIKQSVCIGLFPMRIIIEEMVPAAINVKAIPKLRLILSPMRYESKEYFLSIQLGVVVKSSKRIATYLQTVRHTMFESIFK